MKHLEWLSALPMVRPQLLKGTHAQPTEQYLFILNRYLVTLPVQNQSSLRRRIIGCACIFPLNAILYHRGGFDSIEAMNDRDGVIC
jgi:hypothetical protein